MPAAIYRSAFWGIAESAPASAFGVLSGNPHPRKHSESTRRGTFGDSPKSTPVNGRRDRNTLRSNRKAPKERRRRRVGGKRSGKRALLESPFFFFLSPLSREGANREKLTVKKIINNEMFFFFTVYVPYKP